MEKEDLLMYNYKFRLVLGLGIWKDTYKADIHGLDGYQYTFLLSCLLLTFSIIKQP